MFETDHEYLKWLNECVETKTPYRLFSMGHSLDVTDQDIIAELFRNAKEIIILYHDVTAKRSYIANLVRMFGKDGFDTLKKDKKLTFVSLDQDLKSLKSLLSEESWRDLHAMLEADKGEKIEVI